MHDCKVQAHAWTKICKDNIKDSMNTYEKQEFNKYVVNLVDLELHAQYHIATVDAQILNPYGYINTLIFPFSFQ